MRIHVTTLRKKRSGAVHRATREVAASRVRIGRETGSEIHLADPRILKSHAEIVTIDGAPTILAVASAELTHEQRTVSRKALVPGDAIGIGPYELRVREPGPDGVLSVDLELVRPPGSELESLRRRSRSSLADTALSMRGLSWIAFVAMLLVGATLALPLILGPGNPSVLDRAWSAGELSNAHRSSGNDCTPCHVRPFAAVADAQCLACHGDIRRHFDEVDGRLARDVPCARCHVEHEGATGGTVRTQTLCAGCHAKLQVDFPGTELADAADFGTLHPEFRPLVARADGWTRASADAAPVDRNGLQFSHAWHLLDPKVRVPGEGRAPVCSDCHRPDRRTGEMIPISMERDCRGCHRMAFEPLRADRNLVHGAPGQVIQQIEDLQASIALEGGVSEDGASPSVRRRPGTRLRPRERAEALEWARGRASETIRTAFGASLCGQCHDVESPDESSNGTWAIRPVRIEGSRYPAARFPHAAHGAVACRTCHAAEESRVSSDLLLPDLATCRTCHGGEFAPDRVPSTCVSCHPYHGTDTLPMDPAAASRFGVPG